MVHISGSCDIECQGMGLISGRCCCWSNYFGPIEMVTEHNHMPNPEKTSTCLALTDMLERAKISNDKPRAIIKVCQLNVDEESAPYMVRSKNIRQRINRIRTKKVDYGPNPASIADIEIPPELKVTHDGQNFLFRLL